MGQCKIDIMQRLSHENKGELELQKVLTFSLCQIQEFFILSPPSMALACIYEKLSTSLPSEFQVSCIQHQSQ